MSGLPPPVHVLGVCEDCGRRCDAKRYQCGGCAQRELTDERANDRALYDSTEPRLSRAERSSGEHL